MKLGSIVVLTIHTASFHSTIRGNRTHGTNGEYENCVGDQKLHKGGQQAGVAHDESWKTTDRMVQCKLSSPPLHSFIQLSLTNTNKDQRAEHGQSHGTENARKSAQGSSYAVIRNAKLDVASVTLRRLSARVRGQHPIPQVRPLTTRDEHSLWVIVLHWPCCCCCARSRQHDVFAPRSSHFISLVHKATGHTK